MISTIEKKYFEFEKSSEELECAKKCIQCGTCAGSCPVVDYMDSSPRKMFGLLRGGYVEEAVKSNTPWICASCYLCTVRCPKEIKITDIMYALKRFATREKTVPHGITGSVMAETFANMIKKYGRNAEAEMLTTYFLKTNPFGLMGIAPMGMALFMKGRIVILPHTIKGKNELDAIINKAKEIVAGDLGLGAGSM